MNVSKTLNENIRGKSLAFIILIRISLFYLQATNAALTTKTELPHVVVNMFSILGAWVYNVCITILFKQQTNLVYS